VENPTQRRKPEPRQTQPGRSKSKGNEKVVATWPERSKRSRMAYNIDENRALTAGTRQHRSLPIPWLGKERRGLLGQQKKRGILSPM